MTAADVTLVLAIAIVGGFGSELGKWLLDELRALLRSYAVHG